MTCHSGGTLEVFVDVAVPQRQVVLVGHSPLISILASLAATTGFRVVICDPLATAERFPQAHQVVPALAAASVTLDARSYVVVATHGQNDEDALATTLRSNAGYVALVASRRRAEVCQGHLVALGVAAADLARLHAPAGLDLGAESQAEIAVTILAEIIQHAHAAAASGDVEADDDVSPTAEVTQATEALDPVCGMVVEATAGTPTVLFQERCYYFCSGGCRRRFERDPARWLATAGSSH
jgi:xanthine dehydrogenase accessory factor